MKKIENERRDREWTERKKDGR